MFYQINSLSSTAFVALFGLPETRSKETVLTLLVEQTREMIYNETCRIITFSAIKRHKTPMSPSKKRLKPVKTSREKILYPLIAAHPFRGGTAFNEQDIFSGVLGPKTEIPQPSIPGRGWNGLV